MTTARAAAVPRLLDQGARWAWRFVVVCAAIGIILWSAAQLRVVVIPVFVAFILAALLTPAGNWTARRLPRLAATWAVLLAVTITLAGGAVLLAQPIASAAGELGSEFRQAVDQRNAASRPQCSAR